MPAHYATLQNSSSPLAGEAEQWLFRFWALRGGLVQMPNTSPNPSLNKTKFPQPSWLTQHYSFGNKILPMHIHRCGIMGQREIIKMNRHTHKESSVLDQEDSPSSGASWVWSPEDDALPKFGNGKPPKISSREKMGVICVSRAGEHRAVPPVWRCTPGEKLAAIVIALQQRERGRGRGCGRCGGNVNVFILNDNEGWARSSRVGPGRGVHLTRVGTWPV